MREHPRIARYCRSGHSNVPGLVNQTHTSAPSQAVAASATSVFSLLTRLLRMPIFLISHGDGRNSTTLSVPVHWVGPTRPANVGPLFGTYVSTRIGQDEKIAV
ncbi:hypothetical protein ACFX13_034024 [Malus domestica]|uniref:Uncharacterized protein n=1 Tax=Malus domestica TaxID=3750 RepID=A0A498K0Q2_MALDO|nr:hypothetical protein DVH24_015098 [Malus domestica]